MTIRFTHSEEEHPDTLKELLVAHTVAIEELCVFSRSALVNEVQAKLESMSPERRAVIEGRLSDLIDLFNKLDIDKISKLIETIMSFMSLFDSADPSPAPTPPDVV